MQRRFTSKHGMCSLDLTVLVISPEVDLCGMAVPGIKLLTRYAICVPRDDCMTIACMCTTGFLAGTSCLRRSVTTRWHHRCCQNQIKCKCCKQLTAAHLTHVTGYTHELCTLLFFSLHCHCHCHTRHCTPPSPWLPLPSHILFFFLSQLS
jgi:hypothetical protein